MTWTCTIVGLLALAGAGLAGFLAAAMLAAGKMADVLDELHSVRADFQHTLEAPCPHCGLRE